MKTLAIKWFPLYGLGNQVQLKLTLIKHGLNKGTTGSSTKGGTAYGSSTKGGTTGSSSEGGNIFLTASGMNHTTGEIYEFRSGNFLYQKQVNAVRNIEKTFEEFMPELEQQLKELSATITR